MTLRVSKGRRCLVAAAAFVALVTPCEAARAEEPGPSAPDVAPAYTLDVDSDAPDTIAFDTIASSLSANLGAPVAHADGAAPSRAAITIRYRAATRTLSVRTVHAGGEVVEREVTAAAAPDAARREAVLLAANLARDEAHDLLRTLRPPPAPAPAPAPPPAPAEPLTRPITLAILYPLATNSGTPDVTTSFDLSLVYNHVGTIRGVQLAIAADQASRAVHGWQAAVGATISEGDVDGVQTAVGAAIALHDVRGDQSAVGLALTTGRVEGAQLSDGASLALGGVTGLQASAGANVTSDVHGAQIAGGLNVARDVTGAQIGIVNIGRVVHGAQIGVLNVAEQADEAVGIVSIARDAIHPIAWGGNLAYANVGLKFLSHHVYSVAAFTIGTPEMGSDGLGSTFALGAHVPLPASFDVEIEGDVSSLVRVSRSDHELAVRPRLLAGYSFAPHLRVFAGGGARIPALSDEREYVVHPEGVAGVQF